MEADKTEGLLYEHLVLDHEQLDVTSEARCEDYLGKVYKLVTFAWKEISVFLQGKTLEIYKMRYRNKWEGADSIYDAWLLSLNLRRSWFPYRKFNRLFPFWRKLCESFVQEEVSSNEETTDDEILEEVDELSSPKKICEPKGIDQAEIETPIDAPDRDNQESDQNGEVNSSDNPVVATTNDTDAVHTTSDDQPNTNQQAQDPINTSEKAQELEALEVSKDDGPKDNKETEDTSDVDFERKCGPYLPPVICSEVICISSDEE